MRLIFQDPRFRLLWLSSTFNDMSLMMHMMVQGWLTLTITDSPFWVGAAMGMNGLGLMCFSGVGGVLADRLDRRKLIMASQTVQITLSVALAALTFTDQIQLWHILAAAFIEGMAVAAKVPARMALTLDVVGRERLLSATAANFAGMTVMGVVAPLVGGAVISAFDIAWAYVIMAGGRLTSTAILLNLRGVARVEAGVGSPWQDLKQGVRYVVTTPPVRTLILIVLVTESLGWSHESMLPVMARDVLDVGASGLGYLLATAAGGATIATVIVSNLDEVRDKGRLMLVGLGGFGLFLMLFAASTWLPLSMILLALSYAAVMAYETTLSTLLQTSVPDQMRGRVLSFQTFTWGTSQVSGFHMGAIANAVGAPVAIAIAGGLVMLNALRLLPTASRFREQPDQAADH